MNEDKKFVSQYKLHANKHIYKLISLQLQVINSFKYVKRKFIIRIDIYIINLRLVNMFSF